MFLGETELVKQNVWKLALDTSQTEKKNKKNMVYLNWNSMVHTNSHLREKKKRERYTTAGQNDSAR